MSRFFAWIATGRWAAQRALCVPLLTVATALGAGGCELVRPQAAAEPERGDEPGPVPKLLIADGEDYGLPSWVTAEPFSGYVNHPRRGDPAIGGGQRSCWTSWAELEPQRGEYDWAPLEAALAAAEAGGYTISLHIQSIVCGGYSAERDIAVPRAVPDWVIEEFKITPQQQVNLYWEFNIRVIPAWRPDIRAAFEDLIRTLGERGYGRRPGLGSVYVHGISPSRGEEFWLTQQNIDTLQRLAGLTPQLLEEWIGGRMQAYAEAFAGEVHKVAWVGRWEPWRYVDPSYADVALRLVHTAWDLGLGNRNGSIEHYHRYVNAPAFGQAVDADGYLTVDETIPPIATVRYFGSENEEYGDAWTGRFGDRAGEPQRYRLSMLRALQMRLRFLWTSEAAEALNPPLSEYARLSFGKTVANSPDAWAYLTETPAGTHWSPAGAIKNFERWLLQRDVPGGVTVPAERVERAFNSGVAPANQLDMYHDHVARRTDRAGGSPYMYFDLDERFLVPGAAQIKVEFRDDSDASWRLEYLTSGDELASTLPVTNLNDGRVKTATFLIDDALFAGGLPHGMDFRIACDGPQDVTVRWVRLIRDDCSR